jgi:hypothetical protein
MKKINYIIICLLIIGAWAVGYFNQYYRAPIIEKTEVEVIKEVVVTDTIYVDKIIEEKIYVPKYITEIKTDTLQIVKEVIVEKPVEVIKTVYVDKPYETIVDRYVLPEAKWYLGFGYKFDTNNFFSGTDVKLIRKWKSDKMFSLDVGLRNDLLDKETGVSKLYPYVGASIYFRLDKPKSNF